MKNHIILSFLLLFIPLLSKSQNSIKWANKIEGHATYLQSVTDNQGAVYTQGRWIGSDTIDFEPGTGNHIYTNRSYINQYFITKHDSLGNFKWVVFLNYWMFMEYVGNKILLSNATYTRTTFTDASGNETDINYWGYQAYTYLIVDKNGNLATSSYFENNARTFIMMNAEKVIDDEVLFTGFFEDTVHFGFFFSIIATNNNNWWSYFIMRQDKFGVFKMAKALDFDVSSVGIDLGISLDSAKNILLPAVFTGDIDVDQGPGVNIVSSQGAANLVILKYDSMGNYIQHFHLKNQGGGIKKVDFDEAGNFVLTGELKDSINLSFNNNPNWLYQSQNNQSFMASYDKNGTLQWHKKINGNMKFKKLLIHENGDIYFSAEFSQTVNLDPGYSNYSITSNPNFSSTPQDDFLARYNENGDLIGVFRLSAFEENIYDFRIGPNDQLLVNGDFYGVMFSPATGLNSLNLSLSNCCPSPFLISYDKFSVELEENVKAESLNIFPNPTNGEIQIRIEEELIPLDYEIISITGRKVKSGHLDSQVNYLNLSNLTKGLHIFIAKSDHKTFRQKLILH